MNPGHYFGVALAITALFAGCGGAPATEASPQAATSSDAGTERSVAAAAVSPIPGTLQAENATSKTGGRAIPRSNAEGETVWHLDLDQELSFVLDGVAPADYEVAIRHSNDDLGAGDTLTLLVNGVKVGAIHAADTGTQGHGYDWDTFVVTVPVSLGSLGGRCVITCRLTSTDGYGVDVDTLVFSLSRRDEKQ
jgi:hypothetical protein